jgi:hypothetical protein
MLTKKTNLHRMVHGGPVAMTAALLTVGLNTQASTDYGPAIWRPLCEANYYVSGSGHKFHVIHDMEGYYASVVSWFSSCGMTTASIHYAVNGKQDASSDAAAGEVTQLGVRDSQYAWHARCWNQHCTGTEHEGFASNPAWYTDAMYSASAGVTRNVSARFGWAKDRNHVIGHGQKSVPGWSTWASPNLGIDPNCNTHTDPGAYWDWTKYMGMVNNATTVSAGDPSAVSWSANRIDVFIRGSTGALQHKNWDGAAWSGWENLGGTIVGGPDACSTAAGRLDVFARGTDNALYHIYYQAGWSAWEKLGGVITSDPSAVASGNGRIDVFARGSDNAIWTISYQNGWSAWSSLGGTSVGSPDAASWGAGRLDVVIPGSNNSIWHRAGQNGTWTAWEDLGGGFTSDPSVVSWGVNRLDIYARGNDNALWHKWWDGTWSGWQSLGGGMSSGPDASAWSNRLDVFNRGLDGGLWHWYWDGTTGAWQSLGSIP